MFQFRITRLPVFFVSVVAIAFVLIYVYRGSTLPNRANTLSGSVVLEKIAKHILLPTSAPSVAFVTDTTLLNQRSSFFKKAQNGDAVVIYPEKVIIYNPREDKIVDIFTREVSNNGPTESPGLTKAP